MCWKSLPRVLEAEFSPQQNRLSIEGYQVSVEDTRLTVACVVMVGIPTTAKLSGQSPFCLNDAQVRPPSAHSSTGEAGRLSTEAIQVIAQSVPNLPVVLDTAASALAPDAEYRLREIIQDSVKFMRHAKRRRLTTNDINAALRLRNVEPMYGFGHSLSSHANEESSARGPGLSTPVSSRAGDTLAGDAEISNTKHSAPEEVFVTSPFNKVDGVRDLFFVEDAEVNVKSLAEKPIPPVPLDYSVASHWLAVEGIQPAVPQNPVTTTGVDPDAGMDSSRRNGTERRSADIAEPVVKPRVKHVLGKELQLYYEHVTSALEGTNQPQRDACLVSLAEEPGLVQLLPYFTLHVRESVHKSLRNLPVLFSLMRMSLALLTNPHFQIENYLHQLLPPVLTCLVGKRLCAKPRENHWALRNFAAELIAEICARYGPKYSSVQPRITKTLKDALQDPNRPLTTHYGAIVGLGSLGVHVVDLLVIPQIQEYSSLVLSVLDETTEKLKSVRRYEAAKVYGALAWAVSITVNKIDGVALQDSSLVASTPRDKIGDILPSYAERFATLHETYGSDLFPSSAIRNASAISAKLADDQPK
jgi:transcription initiation factor TFIID subunit 6